MDENATGEKEPILWEGAAAWSQFIWLYLIVGIMMLRVALLARTIHEYLLRRPILSPGVAFLVRPPRRTASTPASASLARSPGGLRSRTPRDGIHE